MHPPGRQMGSESRPTRTAAIQSIAKAIRVLKAFSKAHPEYSVTDLSRELGWHKAVVHKILTTLQRDRLVQQDPASRRYRLGQIGRAHV